MEILKHPGRGTERHKEPHREEAKHFWYYDAVKVPEFGARFLNGVLKLGDHLFLVGQMGERGFFPGGGQQPDEIAITAKGAAHLIFERVQCRVLDGEIRGKIS